MRTEQFLPPDIIGEISTWLPQYTRIHQLALVNKLWRKVVYDHITELTFRISLKHINSLLEPLLSQCRNLQILRIKSPGFPSDQVTMICHRVFGKQKPLRLKELYIPANSCTIAFFCPKLVKLHLEWYPSFGLIPDDVLLKRMIYPLKVHMDEYFNRILECVEKHKTHPGVYAMVKQKEKLIQYLMNAAESESIYQFCEPFYFRCFRALGKMDDKSVQKQCLNISNNEDSIDSWISESIKFSKAFVSEPLDISDVEELSKLMLWYDKLAPEIKVFNTKFGAPDTLLRLPFLSGLVYLNDSEQEFKNKFLDKPEQKIEPFEKRITLEAGGIKLYRELQAKYKVMYRLYDFFVYHATRGLLFQLLSLLTETERHQLAKRASELPEIMQNCSWDYKWLWKLILHGKNELEELIAFETYGLIEAIVQNCPKLRVLHVHRVKASKTFKGITSEFHLIKKLPNLRELKLERVDAEILNVLTELQNLETLEVTITLETEIDKTLKALSLCKVKNLIIRNAACLKPEYFMKNQIFKNLERFELCKLDHFDDKWLNILLRCCREVKTLVISGDYALVTLPEQYTLLQNKSVQEIQINCTYTKQRICKKKPWNKKLEK